MLSRDTKEHDIPVGKRPWKIAIDTSATNHRVYVANQFNSSVSVINPNTNMRELDIRVCSYPLDIAISHFGKIYVANTGSNTVSVINTATDKKEHDILVGTKPLQIAYDEFTHMIYVINLGNITFVPRLHAPLGAVSVINGSSDKVAAGVIFSVNPANSGKIICNKDVYPTNIYLHLDAGTNCMAQPNRDYFFNTWVAFGYTAMICYSTRAVC